MLFSSITFIFMFLPVTMLIYFLVPQKMKNLVMLAASLIFYAWGEPVYVCLLLLCSVFHYFCGRDIEDKADDPARAKRSLMLAVFVNVLLLGFFKYYGALMDSINGLLVTDISYRELSMPVGITIYTFRSLSYLIDVYKKEAKAQKNFVSLALYISMFPQLLAGPVVRYTEIEAQLEQRSLSVQRFGNGAILFICGLAKKAVLADSMGLLHEQIAQLSMGTFSVLTAWIGCAAFAFQIYFELGGVSDMAIGISRMFGFDLRRNFYYPYTAKSISEFWKRWNISLAAWFREYVYAPFRKERGEVYGQAGVLLLIGVMTGLWYGAAGKFLVWGIFFGILLAAERSGWGKRMERLPAAVRHICTMALILIGWVFFFSPDLGYAADYIGVMFGLGARAFADGQAVYFLWTHWLLIGLCVIGASLRGSALIQRVIEIPQSVQARRITLCVVYIVLFITAIAFLVTGTGKPFAFVQI